MNKNKFCKSIISILVVLAFISSSVSAFASSKTQDEATSDFKKRIIVKLKHTDKKDEVLKNVKKNLKLSKLKEKKNLKLEKINVFEIDDPDAIDSLISEFSKSPQVEFVQEDYLLETMGIPFDERLFEQWWINNSGQVINGQPGISGIDINVLNAWEMTKGSDEIVVGVLDTGIDIEHTDLKDKIFVNTAEIPDNGIDDDLNGFVDDFKGWDFYNNDNSVFDSNENDKHGSHVAGTIAAKEDAYGICGTAPNVKILPLKFLNGNVGYTSDVIEAISYCEEMGIDIINCSWGGTEENKLLKEAISKSSAVFICAAGNMRTDTTKVYPASYDLPNVISVAALDNRGNLASFSNYGNNVDVAAPGAGILSTIPGDAYGYLNGTSMAAPVVTGIAALLKSYCPNISSNEIVRRIENNVVKTPKLEGKIFSGGMVDAEAVLNNVVPEPKDVTDYIDKAGAKEIIHNPMDNTLEGNGKTSDVLIIDDSGFVKRQTRPQNIGLTTVSQNVYSQQSTLSYTSHVETEPNNYSSEAMPVETGTLYGTIQSSSDEDWYVVYLEANKKYTFNLRGLQQGDDLDLFLTNPDLSYAGSSMIIGNENIVFTTTIAGYYYVSTYCFSYATSGEHEYQILIYPDDEYESNDSQGTSKNINSSFAAYASINIDTDVDWYNIDVDSASKLTVSLEYIPYGCDYDLIVYNQNSVVVGSSYFSGNTSEKVNVLVGSPGRYYIKVYPYSGSNPGSYYKLMASVSNPDQYETNDFEYEARSVPLGSSISATIDNINDVDLFETSVGQQGYYSFKLENIPVNNDYDIYIYDMSGNYLEGSCLTGNNDENVIKELGTGTYLIKVVSYFGESDSVAYNLSIDQYSLLTATMPDIPANIGDYVEVPVNVQNISQNGICSYLLKLSYDKNALTYIDYVSGDPLALTGEEGSDIMETSVEDVEDGLRILYIDNSATFSYPIINEGNVITLRFQVNSGISDGAYGIEFGEGCSFSEILADGTMRDVNIVRFDAGSVIIGDYQQSSLSAFEDRVIVVTPMEYFKLGDLDHSGRINSTDYAMLKRFILNPSESKEQYGLESYYAGDLTKDEKVNSTDYSVVKRHLLDLIPSIENLGQGCVIYSPYYEPEVYYDNTSEAQALVNASNSWFWDPGYISVGTITTNFISLNLIIGKGSSLTLKVRRNGLLINSCDVPPGVTTLSFTNLSPYTNYLFQLVGGNVEYDVENVYTLSSGTGGILNNWLVLSDTLTYNNSGRIVGIPTDANPRKWAMIEGLSTINHYALEAIGDSNKVIIGSRGELLDKNGRYWVAVGPKVMNPNITNNSIVYADDMKYGTLIDVVLIDDYGRTFYVKAVVGDCKIHTYPNGIYQTGYAFPNGTDPHPSNNDGSIIEFIGKASIIGFSEYRIQRIIVYDN